MFTDISTGEAWKYDTTILIFELQESSPTQCDKALHSIPNCK